LKDASILAEKLRNTIALFDFEDVGQRTASFGVAVLSDNEEANELISRADTALYQSKENGRNQVYCAD